MSKKNKPQKEYIPEGMSRKDYADAAFRKKVTIIMGCILLTFVIGVVAVLVNAWAQTEKHNKEFEAREQAFIQERDSVLAQLAQAETAEDKAKVQIVVTDENYSDWIATLDASYQLQHDDENYGAYAGASIKLQGMFITKKFEAEKNTIVQYWVQRYHSHDEGNHDEHTDHSLDETIPIEVIWSDKDFTVPVDGTWVDVTGIVGLDSTKNLSAVRNAVITVMDEPGEAHIE